MKSDDTVLERYEIILSYKFLCNLCQWLCKLFDLQVTFLPITFGFLKANEIDRRFGQVSLNSDQSLF